MRHACTSFVATGFAVASLAMTAANPAHASPDAGSLAGMRREIGNQSVRVVATTGTWTLPAPMLDSLGIHPRGIYRAPRVALIQTPDAKLPPPPPAIVRWDDIEELRVSRSRRAVLASGLIGGAILGGAGASITAGLVSTEIADVAPAAAIGFAIGAAGGMLLANLVQDWKRVYP